MYEAFFGLKKKPFELVPNPDFLYLSRSHSRAGTYLDYAMKENTGFILLTGEVGAGKTTIIRKLLGTLGPNVQVSKVFNTKLDSDQLIATINDDFGLEIEGRSKVQMLKDLYHFLIEQYGRERRSVLIIDEAQNLSIDSLEELRMLSNLETNDSKLLQIIMVGQPELKKILSVPELRQLRQRISIHCHITPLSAEETAQYVLHRLEVAGNRDAVLFEKEALPLIHEYCGGIPRLINVLCDFLLLSAFAEETHVISGDLVDEVASDTQFEGQFLPRKTPRPPPRRRPSPEEEEVRSAPAPAAAAQGRTDPPLAPEAPLFSSTKRAAVYSQLDAFEACVHEVCRSLVENEFRLDPQYVSAKESEDIVIEMPDFKSPGKRWLDGLKKIFTR
jgi:general secretion pathway protein A